LKSLEVGFTADIASGSSHSTGPTRQMFQAIVMAMDEGVVFHNKSDGVYAFNPAAERILGLAAPELNGKPSQDRAWPARTIHEDGSAFPGDLHPAMVTLRTGEPQRNVVMGFHRPDGTPVWISINSHPLVSDGESEPDAVVSTFRDITEHKRKVDEKKVSLNFLSNVLSAIADPVFVKDRLHRWVLLNEAFSNFIGHPLETLLGKSDYDFFPASEAQVFWEKDEIVFSSGLENVNEEEFTSADGIKHTIITKKTCYTAADGQQFLVGIITDITERKHMEAERLSHLRFFESMDRVNRAMQGASDLDQMMSDVLDTVLSIFDCDRASLTFPCDPEATDWRVSVERNRPEYPGNFALGLKVPMDEAVAESLCILLDADGPVQFGPGAAYPLPAGVSERFGCKCFMSMAVYPKLGKPWQFGIHQCSHPRIWTRDEELLFQKIGRRLTDCLSILLTFRELQASEQEFRTLAENAPDNIARYDLQGRLIYLNPRLERTLRRPADQLLGKRCEEKFPDRDFEFYENKILHVAATGEKALFEVQVPGDDGLETHMIHMVAERDVSGTITGVLAIGRDITERKQAERQLREFSSHLQAVREEEKAHFAREIHDDLGSTLVALKMEASLLARGLSADHKTTSLSVSAESMVGLLDNAVAAMRRIITDLRPPMLDDFGLMATLKWHADQFHKHTGIECRLDCVPIKNKSCNGMSNGCNDCEGMLNNAQTINIFRIFQEVLNNVARHSGASRVIIEFRPGHNQVVLSIRDNGRGLPESRAIDSTSYGIRGMRERAKQLGGKIKFDSSSGDGLHVTLKVPLPAPSM